MDNQSNTSSNDFSLGNFTVHASRNLITKDAQECAITPKMLAVLTELAKNQGKTLSKEVLMKAVWGSVSTSDMVLSRAISDLRKVFGDSARKQHYIETVSKQGYRLCQPVRWELESLEQVQNWYSRKKIFQLFLVALTILTVGLWFIDNQSPNSPAHFSKAPKITQLTSDSDIETGIRFSTNGDYLIYNKRSPNEPGIKLIMRTIADNHVSTFSDDFDKDNPIYNLRPVFSHDDKQILFRQYNQSSDKVWSCNFILFNLTDRKKRKLISCPRSGSQSFDWSQDNKSIVLGQGNTITNSADLVLINLDDASTKKLTTPEFLGWSYLFPRFSPKGKFIAFVLLSPDSTQWAIGTFNMETGEILKVYESIYQLNQVVWSETVDKLYFVVKAQRDAGIWELNLNTFESKHLHNANILGMDYNRKTRKFSYIEKTSDISVIKTFLSNDKLAVTTTVFDSIQKVHYTNLSPNNKKLAYLSEATGIHSLWVRDLESKTEQKLYQKEGVKLQDIAWSHDSKQLMFTVIDNQQSSILQLDIQSQQQKTISKKTVATKGMWSFDGRFKYWVEKTANSWYLVEKNVLSGTKRTIHVGPVSHYQVTESNQLFYQEFSSSKIFSKNLNDTDISNKFDEMVIDLGGQHLWSVTSNFLYYTSKTNSKNKKRLNKYNILTKTNSEVFPVDESFHVSYFYNSMSVSTDGTTVYYNKVDKTEIDIFLLAPQ